MLFFSFFKSIVGEEITVELKSDLKLTGTLHSADQFLNFRLNDVRGDVESFPQLAGVRNCFIRGSVVRYVHLPGADVIDLELLTDATRRQASSQQAAAKHAAEAAEKK